MVDVIVQQNVDWKWANARDSLSIIDAVGLSLGYELNTLAPVGRKWVNRPDVEQPAEFKLRVAATYEAVLNQKIRCVQTAERGATFALDANFDAAQFWEVDLIEFRQYCDARNWSVPAEFLPDGYAKKEGTWSAQADRQASRWQACIDAGLTMPTDTYGPYPRGIGEVAKEMGITRQALTHDLNAHRERIFPK